MVVSALCEENGFGGVNVGHEFVTVDEGKRDPNDDEDVAAEDEEDEGEEDHKESDGNLDTEKEGSRNADKEGSRNADNDEG